MQRLVLYIIMCGIAAGIVSIVYFLLLAAGFIDFPAIVAIELLCVFFTMRYLHNNLVRWAEDDGRKHWGSIIILTIGIITIAIKSAPYFEKYGAWDAWAIWNLQAKYMAEPEHWRTMFLNTQYGHPDYPLLIPGIAAFLSRISACSVEVVGFTFSIGITMMIPLLLFMQLRANSILLASYVLFVLATDKHFLSQGVSMYADTPLAFFFLCALIAMRQTLYGNKQVILAAAALGCCMWTKNEGVVLSAVFCIFYFREMFGGGRVKYFSMGIALPLATWLLFKSMYAPTNELTSSLKTDAMNWLTDTGRYKQVLTAFWENIDTQFSYLKGGAIVYVLICLLRRQWPGKDMYMLLTCIAAYTMIYVMTSYGLEWHLRTSADRLMHQLMPAMVFIIAEHIAGKGLKSSFIVKSSL